MDTEDAKSKAMELFVKLYQIEGRFKVDTKQCALVVVDYLIQEQSNNYYFWIEVKKEIENL